MLIRSALRAGPERRGVILLVVLALLTLFAILGLSFVFYSDAEATSSRIFRESQSYTRPGSDLDRSNSDATAAFNGFLSQFIYDVNDDTFGTMSALRGHSLARTMYGWNDGQGDTMIAASPAGTLNDKPFCGTGRLAETLPLGLTGQQAVNYTYYASDGWLRDPGRGGNSPSAAGGTTGTRKDPTKARLPLVGDLNVPYTYPDQNNMFLAMIDPSSGQVMIPSYYRNWLLNNPQANMLANFNDPNWTSADGKYRLLRPRRAEVDPNNKSGPDPNGLNGFPFPCADANGDVKNLDWAPGGNDSIWIDPNFPVVTLPDGTQYKVLVAPLIIDLDGRINMNVAGNILATSQTVHASNSGWGPYEVNLSKMLNADNTEWLNVFKGTTVGGSNYPGRYSYNPNIKQYVPLGTLPFGGGTKLRAYYPMDYNGITDPMSTGGQLSSVWNLPGAGSAKNFQIFPYYNPNAYGNAAYQETTYDGTQNGVAVHPSIYNPLQPPQGTTAFTYTDLAAILRRMDLGGDSINSNLMRLLPNNLIADPNAAYRRARLTTHSFDVDRPGIVPYVWDPSNMGFGYNPKNASPAVPPWYPVNGPLYPTVATPIPINTATLANRNPNAIPAGSEFDPGTWQSIFAALGRVDLGRALTNYPAQQAVNDRQQFAQDIFNVLWQVTGSLDPNSAAQQAPKGASPAFLGLQWLAQLAVNIVDFIDSDDYNTPFNWYPQPGNKDLAGKGPQWVFGTEMPRLVINEYYAQWDNDRADVTRTRPNKDNGTNRVNVWVELYNPFPTDSGDPSGQNGTVQLYNRQGRGGYSIYQLLLCQGPNNHMRDMNSTYNNTLGQPDQQLVPVPANAPNYTTVGGNGRLAWGVNPATGAQSIPPGFPTAANPNAGFYVVGPTTGGGTNVYRAPLTAANPTLPTTFQSPNMTYTLPATTDPGMAANAPSLILQRLANPYLPLQNTPTAANYNPYITVDYVPQVFVNNGRLYDAKGQTANAPPTFNNRYSFGRRQPFSATCTTTSNPNPDKILNNNTYPNPWPGNPAISPALVPPPAPAYSNTAPITNADPQTKTYGQWVQAASQPNGASATAPPCNTFNSQNSGTVNGNQTLYYSNYPGQNGTAPFDVQYHPDRPPISLADLLHVSGYKNHEFTQQFVDVGGNKFAHRAPWSDQTSGISRLFDFLTISGRMNGQTYLGRIPGKININTIFDRLSTDPNPGGLLFQALCDRQTANQFTVGQVNAIWDALVKSRDTATQNVNVNGQNIPTYYMPGASSQPFWSLGMGYSTAADLISPNGTRGIANTPLRATFGASPPTNTQVPADLTQLRLLEPSSTLPGAESIQRFELLSKILGNLTTRSNVFGVWVTVGFFTVPPGGANTRPVQLGKEYIWPSSQAPIRHKFFAIIDRTQLQVWPTYAPNGLPTVSSKSAITLTAGSSSVTAAVSLQDANGNAISAQNPVINPNTYNTVTYNTNAGTTRVWTPGWLQTSAFTGAAIAGTSLTFDPGTTNEETVIVPNTGKATFFRSHSAGCVVISRGNPGPWSVPYDPGQDADVVPYAVKIN